MHRMFKYEEATTSIGIDIDTDSGGVAGAGGIGSMVSGSQYTMETEHCIPSSIATINTFVPPATFQRFLGSATRLLISR